MKHRSKGNQVRPADGRTALWHPTHLGVHPLVRAMAACSLLSFWTGGPQAQALPTGMNTVAGQVSTKTSGNAMTVTNSPNAIINWKSFSIGAQNSVRFDQVNSTSKVLNRVTGNDPSSILGSLSSNGHVWLLNQNGVLFGQGARVNVAGLVASTLNMSDANWLLGRHQFSLDGQPAADVINQGELRSTLGGQIILLGGSVRNEGVVDAPGGQAILAAGSSIELVDTTTPNIGVKISSSPGQVVNLGQLSAAGGRVDIQAAIINQDGIVRADSLARGPAGEVVMSASERLTLAPGSVTSANGDTGGKLTLDADRNLVGGTVTAKGDAGSGGQVKLLGREIGLLGAAQVDVSGQRGGGEVLVGGGPQGKDPAVPNAQAVYVGPQAGISADAIDAGDGGRVILWSDKATRAFGTFSARGGASGGNGGFIETSGGWLDSRPSKVDTSAAHGQAGMWLLDPYDITISDAVGDTLIDLVLFAGPVDEAFLTPTGSGSSIFSGNISSFLNFANVTISTSGGGGSEAGNITLSNAHISVGVAGPRSLTLNADGGILMTGSTIESTLGPLNVNFNAALSGPGAIRLDTSTVTTGTSGGGFGNIVFGGPVSGTTPTGGSFTGAGGAVQRAVTINDNSHLNAGTADVTLSGFSSDVDGIGVWILSNSSITGHNIDITGDAPLWRGVEVSFGSSITATHSISLRGRGPVIGVGLFNPSLLSLVPDSFDATAQMLLQGRVLTGNDNPEAGVFVAQGGSPGIIVGNGAHLTVEGAAPSSAQRGVRFVSSAVDATDASSMTLRTFDAGFMLLESNVLVGPAGSTTISAADQIVFSGTSLTTTGPIAVSTQNLQTIGGSTLVTSSSSSDTIVLSGGNGTPMATWTSSADPLSASNGRWLAYLTDVTNTSAYPTTGLGYDFKLYNELPGSSVPYSGNGLVFSVPQVATITGTVQTKAYDGTTAASVSNLAAVGVLQDTGVASGTATATFADPNAGVPKSVSVTGVTFAYTDANNKPVYGYTEQGGLQGAIDQAGLTITGAGVDKVYDGALSATVTTQVTSGLVGSQTVGVLTSASFLDKNVGNAKPVEWQVVGLTDGTNGGLASNYFAVIADVTSANITPAPLTLSTSNVTKTYDGGLAAAGTATLTAGTLFGGDSFSGGSFAFTDKNVGVGNKTVTTSGVTVSDGNNGANYDVSYANNTTSTINPASLTLSSSNVIKTYDGGTSAAGTASVTAGTLFAGDTLSGGSFAFTDKNAGVGNKTVTTSGVTVSDGNNGGNYAVSYANNTTSTINPADLFVTGLAVSNKVYDATTAASYSGSPSLSPIIGSDQVTLNSGAASFIDKNVGDGKTVLLGSFSLSGTDAANYALQAPPSLTANITTAPLTLSTSNVTKTYDGGVSATGTASVAAGTLFAGDSLSGGSFAFTDKNVGLGNKTVTTSGVTVSDGNNGGNYAVSYVNNTTSTINPASLTLSTSNVIKTYDGGTSAAGTASVAAGTLFAGDTLSGGSFAFTDKNAGVGNKTVTTSGVTVSDGNNGGNYAVSYVNNTTSTINPADLFVTGLAVSNKVYDATTTASYSGSPSLSPIIGSDQVTLNSGAASFIDKNVGDGKAVLLGSFSLSGSDAANYTLQAPASLTANITPASLTVSGLVANNKVYDATTVATLSGSANLGPVLGSDSVSVSSSSTGAFSDKNVGTAKAVAVSGLTLSGADAGNYILTQPGSLSADITPATLSVSGLVANSKVYDATAQATLSGSAGVTPLGSDSVSVSSASTGTFSDMNVGTGKAVAVSGLTLSGADAGNYTLLQPSGLFADIEQATLQYLANSTTGIFGQPLPPLSGSVSGFKGADSVGASTSGTLSFTSDANEQSPPGSYAVIGGGLSATNYKFEQALTNQTALTVVSLPPSGSPFTAAKEGPTTATDVTVTSVIEPLTLITGPSGGLLDLTTTAASTSTRAAAGTTGGGDIGAVTSNPFQAVDVASQSPAALGDLLVARDAYKLNLFTQATTELEKNPGVADVRQCQTLNEIESGSCMLTEALKREWLAAAASQAKTPAPLPDAPKVAAAPVSDGATVKSAAQYEAEPAFSAPGEAVAVAAPYETLLGSKRRVMTAALPQIERKVAIVIGVDVYKDPSIPTLSNAVKDARAFGQLLESQLGYETVVLENPGKQEVIAALNKVALAMAPNDSVIIYYAGHGWVVESTKVGYWQLADSDAKQPQTWLSNADIGKMVDQLGAAQVALISDSCYSGSLVSNERIRVATKAVDPSEVLAQRTVVVMSSGGNEPVFDSGKNGHSPFAWNLMSALGDLSNWQAGGSVFERVRFAVAKELPQRPQYGAFATTGARAGGDYLFERRQLEAGPQ
jgi:filamentous hemagglutinin family protein